MKRYICYYRVSSKRQGESGLGLDAQRKQVAEFVRSRGGEILQEFTEVESGANDERPQLKAALAASQLYGAPLLIAKLDRLSRSAAFLMTLQESGVEFTCADAPDVCSLTIGVLALVARQERDAISSRTRAALAETRERGVKLGGIRKGQRPPTDEERARSKAVCNERAMLRAERYRQTLIDAVYDHGCNNPADIARHFNAIEIPTPTGKVGNWKNVQIIRLMDRLGLTVRGILKGEAS